MRRVLLRPSFVGLFLGAARGEPARRVAEPPVVPLDRARGWHGPQRAGPKLCGFSLSFVAAATILPAAMAFFRRFFGLAALPLDPSLGLLLHRLALSFLMIRYHGWGKLAGWKDEAVRLPNFLSLAGAENELHTFPDYLGLSSELSYVLVTWLETFGSLAIALGLLTRFHAGGLVIAMSVAFLFHHEADFNGGETAFSFAFGYLLLFLAGPGRHSLDRKLGIGRV